MFVAHASAAYVLHIDRSSGLTRSPIKHAVDSRADRPGEPAAAIATFLAIAITVHRMFVAFRMTTCDRDARTRHRLRDFIQ